MNIQICLTLIIGIHLIFVDSAPQSATTTYETKFDNVDLDEVLQSERLLKNYIKCLENEGPCTPDGKMLRDTLPDAIATNCSKCSERQKYGSDKVTHFLIDQKPEVWQRLEQRYDPEGTYRIQYLATKEQANANANQQQSPTPQQVEDQKVDEEVENPIDQQVEIKAY